MGHTRSGTWSGTHGMGQTEWDRGRRQRLEHTRNGTGVGHGMGHTGWDTHRMRHTKGIHKGDTQRGHEEGTRRGDTHGVGHTEWNRE